MGVKPPQRPEDIFEPLVEDLKKTLGQDLLGVCVFGSAAAGRYQKGKSDINLLLLVADEAAKAASRLIFFYLKWQPANLAPPLWVTPGYLATSLDVFPIEFLVMAAAHKCLYGQDPLANLAIKAGHLRLQLERELKGKLMAIRTRLLASKGQRAALLAVIREALPAFTALFQAFLYLTEGEFPLEPEQVMTRLGRRGLAVEAFLEMGRVRAGQGEPAAQDLVNLLEQAVSELETICRQVDKLEVKESAT